MTIIMLDTFLKAGIICRHVGEIPEWPKGADCKSAAKASKVRILLSPPELSGIDIIGGAE
tara:strand:- start:125 stop:304 length:180 start_codon:yes stop_codon:yes gene_type:complete